MSATGKSSFGSQPAANGYQPTQAAQSTFQSGVAQQQPGTAQQLAQIAGTSSPAVNTMVTQQMAPQGATGPAPQTLTPPAAGGAQQDPNGALLNPDGSIFQGYVGSGIAGWGPNGEGSSLDMNATPIGLPNGQQLDLNPPAPQPTPLMPPPGPVIGPPDLVSLDTTEFDKQQPDYAEYQKFLDPNNADTRRGIGYNDWKNYKTFDPQHLQDIIRESSQPAPVAQPAPQPIAKPVAQPIARPVAQPIAQPIAKPVAQPIARPVAQPIAKPAPMPTKATQGYVSRVAPKPTAPMPVARPAPMPVARPVVKPATPSGQVSKSMVPFKPYITTASGRGTK